MHDVVKASKRGSTRAAAACLLMALLGAPIGSAPVSAEGPLVIANGTIALPNRLGAFNPEAQDYKFLAACRGDRPNGLIAAFVDLRAHQQKTLRFVGEGVSVPARAVTWQVQRATGCPTGIESYQGPIDVVQEPSSLTWQANTYKFLYILRQNDSDHVPALDGHFRVEVVDP